MSREILLLVDALGREKNVEKEVVFGALELALASATKKRFQEDVDVRVAIDRNTGDYEAFRRWKVVPDDTPEYNVAQMTSLEEAQEKKPDAKMDDYIEEPIEKIALAASARRRRSRSSCRRSAMPSASRY